MASTSSRWATSEEDAAAEAQRKREKEERKRLKEQTARKAAEAAIIAPATAEQHSEHGNEDQERPSKRQRTSPAPDSHVEEGANLLQFPSRTFGPCQSIDKYELLNKIEEGSYGKVSRARLKSDGQVVALKKLKLDNPHDGFPITGLREIHTLRSCSHTYIVDLHEVVMGSSLSE